MEVIERSHPSFSTSFTDQMEAGGNILVHNWIESWRLVSKLSDIVCLVEVKWLTISFESILFTIRASYSSVHLK